MFARLIKLVVFLTLVLVTSQHAMALPWDIDMYRQQSLKANEIARAPAEGTVALGRKPMTMSTDEAAEGLLNPVPFDKDSVRRGARVWRSNCYPCHGGDAAGKGPVAAHFAGIPNLLGDLYKGRKDGRIFGVIY